MKKIFMSCCLLALSLAIFAGNAKAYSHSLVPLYCSEPVFADFNYEAQRSIFFCEEYVSTCVYSDGSSRRIVVDYNCVEIGGY